MGFDPGVDAGGGGVGLRNSFNCAAVMAGGFDLGDALRVPLGFVSGGAWRGMFFGAWRLGVRGLVRGGDVLLRLRPGAERSRQQGRHEGDTGKRQQHWEGGVSAHSNFGGAETPEQFLL